MSVCSDDDSWAVTEFADAELGDARRTQRVIALATVLAQRPGASLPEACGDDAMLKAAYRFFDNAAIEPQDLLDSHIGATFPRVATVPLVLAVQDTTELDWTAHPATSGLGPREADVYDLLALERPAGVDVLLRAAWDRCVTHAERYVWATVAAQPVEATATVQVPRRGPQPPRTATLAVRWCPLTLCPPRHRKRERLPTVPLWAVQAREEAPPAGTGPIEWLLLTTCAVHTAAEALERLDWYACRWGVEVWHKILKSGCRIEARQLETAERLQRCLPLYSVIAWRIFYATMLSRAVPDAPCTAILDPQEWQALYCAIHRTPTPPATPSSLRQAVHWIAQLGGFLARRRDGEPGATALWKGLQHLTDLTTMYCIMRPAPPKRKKYG